MSLTELIVSIAGDMSKLTQTINNAATEVGGYGKKISDIGSNLSSAGQSMTAGVTVPILAGGAAFAGAAKMGADFEKGMAQVYTLLPDMSTTAFNQMGKDTLQFANDMKIPTDEVLPALYDAIGSGVPANNVFDFLKTSSKAAIAGNTDLGVSVDTLTSLINAYGAENLSVADASDVLFTGINVGKMSFEELQKSLYDVIPTASSLGVPLDQVTGALAAMTAQGTPTTVATTQLRQMMVELSKDGSGAAKTFQEITGKSFPAFISGGGTLEGALQAIQKGFVANSPAVQELQKKMYELADPTSNIAKEFEGIAGKSFKEFQKEGGTASQALQMLGVDTSQADARLSDMFSSVEAGNAVLQLTAGGGQMLTNVMDDMTKSSGATDAAFQKMNETSSRAFEAMSAEIKNAVTEMGLRLLPVVKDTLVPLLRDTLIPAFESAIKIIATVAEAFNTLPQPVKLIILAVIAFAAALGPVLVAVGAVVGAVGTLATAIGTGGVLAGAFAAAQTAIGVVIAAISAIGAPILIIIGIIALLVVAWTQNWFDIQGKTKAAVDFIVTKAQELRQRLGDSWNAITTAAQQLGAMIGAALTGVGTYLQGAVTTVINFKNSAVASWNSAKASILAVITGMVNDLLTWANNQAARLLDAVAKVNAFKAQALAAWAAVKASVWAILTGIVNDLVTWAANQAAKLADAIAKVNNFKAQAIAAWNATKASILQVLNGLIADFVNWINQQQAKLNDLLNKINTFKTNATNAWNQVKQNIITAMQGIITALQNSANQVATALSNMVTSIKNKASEFYNAGKAIVQNLIDGISAKLTDLKTKISDLASMVSNYLPMHSPALTGALSSLPKWNDILNNPLVKAASSAINTAKTTGSNIINSIVSGVKSAVSKASSAISSAVSSISKYIPHSPAEMGPFSELPNWDAVFYDPMLASINKTGQLALPLQNTLAKVQSPLTQFGAGFGKLATLGDVINNSGDSITVGPNQFSSAVDVEALLDLIDRRAAERRRSRGVYR